MKLFILYAVILMAVFLVACGLHRPNLASFKRFAADLLWPVHMYVQRVFVLNMINYVQDGDLIDITTPYAVSSGGGCLVGTRLFGIAVDTYASNAAGVLAVEGVFDIAKATGVSFAAGAPVYWDDTNKVCTTSGTGSALEVGICTSTAGTAATTVRAKLNEPPR